MKKRWKGTIGLIACITMLCSSIPVSAKTDKVKMTTKEYVISLQKSNPIFISNEKSVSGKVGSKMFLTYTVDKVTSKPTADIQNGILGTTDNTMTYPYVKEGNLQFTEQNVLLDEGYTYVFRFERNDEGFYYEGAKLKDDEVIPINFDQVATDNTTDAYKYCGLWFAGSEGVSAILNHVRCYDESGNDLGIHFNAPTGVLQSEMNALIDKHFTVNSNYSFTLEDANTVAISNKYPTDSEVIYMEYEVSDVKDDKTYHQGVIMTRTPLAAYPYDAGNGWMLFNMYDTDNKEHLNKGEKQLLLTEGAKYFICFVRKEETYDVVVQRTVNGEMEMLSFPHQGGIYDKSFPYVCLWFGEGVEHSFSATFKNFKIYDDEGKSLGVQMRDTAVKMKYRGELEDYSKSKASYYCKDNNSFIILQDDKKAMKQESNVKENVTYRIENGTSLYLTRKSGKEVYTYNPMVITDESGKEYIRMNASKVTFVTGKDAKVVDVDATTGFRIAEPTEPNMSGHTFKGWFTGDGHAFDFEKVITESITLYAKWQDGEGNEFLAVNTDISNNDYTLIIAIVIAGLVLVASGMGCVTIIKRRKSNESKEKTD